MTTAADILDHTPMPQGKYGPHKGNHRTPDWVSQHDPSYLVWAWDNWSVRPCSELLYRECLKDVAQEARERRVSRDQDEL